MEGARPYAHSSSLRQAGSRRKDKEDLYESASGRSCGHQSSCAENPGLWFRSAVGTCLSVYAAGLRRSHPPHTCRLARPVRCIRKLLMEWSDGPPNTTWTHEQRERLRRASEPVRRANRGGRHVPSSRCSVCCVCD
jgi:hypothetical protein